jgi:hypothetical protein
VAGTFQGDAFQNDAFEVGVPAVGTIVSTLPKLSSAATGTSNAPRVGTVASTLPKLSSAATGSIPLQGTVANTLPALGTVITGRVPVLGTVASTLPKLDTDATTIVGIVEPNVGTLANTLPKLFTSTTAFIGAGAPAVGAIASGLPALRTEGVTTVTPPPPPPTPPGDEGLVHIFSNGGSTRVLPDGVTPTPLQMLGGFQDRASMVGGFQSASGVISAEEYSLHSDVYGVGATWLVKDRRLEAAGLDPYIFGGELKKPELGGGVAQLAADGWGLLQDRQVERFLVASMAYDQWAPGDTDPFHFTGGARIQAEVKRAALVFTVARHTSFKKNDAGQPDKWRSVPLVFWAPKTNLRWIKFTLKATGRNMAPYDLELVGTPTGPSGPLTVLNVWNITNKTDDVVRTHQIPDGYDLVGLRVVRTIEAKRVPHARVRITDLKIGSLATDDNFTLTEAYAALFGMMGTVSNNIASTNQDIIPYDAARVSLADIADDLGVFGQWYWRLWADASGGMRGEAGPIGQTNHNVELIHTPIRLLPQPQYNVVQFDYNYGGGYTSQATVRASNDPFPGTDIVYILDLPEAPVFALAERFAQKIADMLSQPWMSGSGTLHKVNAGNQPAGVVRPGDQLTLVNYEGAKVIADEISHSEDGSLVEASFAESSQIVDRWLALFQHRINMGLSPNAAIIDLLDVEEPKKPQITVGFSVSQKREGRRDYDLMAIADTVNEDIEGLGTYVERYGFRARPIWGAGHANAGEPVPDNKGGGWRERSVRAPKDFEVEETKRVVWDKIQRPKDWAWEVQGWAIDALGQRSNRDTVNAGKPAAFKPVNPTGVSLDVDQRVMTVAHNIPPDPDDPSEPDQDYHHAIIKINDENANWDSPLRVDRKVKGESKRFRFHKPIDGQTYYAQVIYVDFWGNHSDPEVASNSKAVPPQPVIGAWDFDASGTKHARFRLRVPVTVNDAGHNDHVKRILVQMVHKATNATPTNADRKFRDYVRVGDDPQAALFSGIPKNHFVFIRAMSIDSDQKESGFTSPWTALGKPKDANLTDAPATPTGLEGNVLVTAPRRIVGNWDDPDDDDVTRWRVIVRKGATVMEDRANIRQSRYVYRVPKVDVGLSHSMQVYALNHLGNQSPPTPEVTAVPTEEAGEALPDPPGVPANPSAVFDADGTVRARFRAIVTAGLSSTGGPVDRYVIQLAHSTNAGAAPPPGTKRQHGSVEGDAVGDDLQEVFRNIPKRHNVWIRERAVNAGGKSNWTPGWVSLGQPYTGASAVAATPSNVQAVTPIKPRRLVWTWNEPDDDDVTRWQVTVKKGAATMEVGNTRNNRYTYRVPKADVNVAHTIEVRAFNDTSGAASGAATPAGTSSAPDMEQINGGTDIAPGSLNLTPFASNLRPVGIGTSLPSPGAPSYPEGATFYKTGSPDPGLYEVRGGTWTYVNNATNMVGDLVAGQISAGAVKASELVADTISGLAIYAGLFQTTGIGGGDPYYISLNGNTGSTEKDVLKFTTPGGPAGIKSTGGGLMIGTGTGQQVGFFGTSPHVFQGGIADVGLPGGSAVDTACRNKLNNLLASLRNYGLC